MIQFSTSMMVANPFKLESQIKTIDQNTDMYHIDLMDGHYVPNIAHSLDFVLHIKPFSTKPIEVHFMVEKAEKYIDQLSKYGVDTMVFHPSTLTISLEEVYKKLLRLGIRFGLALNPDDSFDLIEPYLSKIDVLTVMMVVPGFAGQSMVESALDHIEIARKLKQQYAYTYVIEIDGSNNYKTFEKYVSRGAERLILGSGLFSYNNLQNGFTEIKTHVNSLLK